MSCYSAGIVGRIVAMSTPSIVRGADGSITVQMVHKDKHCSPYAFSNFVGASAYFASNDGATILNFAAELLSADLGKLKIPMAASATLFLDPGEDQTFQVDFRDDSGLTKILFDGALAVTTPLA